MVEAGGWGAPIGITLVADRLAAIMLAVAMLTLLLVLVYAIGQPGAERNHVGFQSAYLILAAGVALSFLTGDLFNLFVAFEMMLTSSYVLMTLGGTHDQVRSGMTYVVISLVASVLFIVALALLYTATGTVNLADLSERIPLLAPGLQSAFAVLLLVVFGIKAAVFPLFFWLPDSYPTAPSPVTAIFAGLLTKVGVYALIRTQLAAVPRQRPALDPAPLDRRAHHGDRRARRHRPERRQADPVVPHRQPDRLHGDGARPVHRRRGGRRHLLHRPPDRGQDRPVPHRRPGRARRRLEPPEPGGGHARHRAGAGRAVPGAGAQPGRLPPMSGFIGKFALLDAGVGSSAWWVVAAAVAAAFLTLFSMIKIWAGVFWNPKESEPQSEPHAPGRWGGPLLMVVPTATLVVLTIAIGVAAGPLYELVTRTAQGLIDPAVYRSEVLGR